MALGGGSFTTMNKVLPGAYINFVSAARASAELSDRGIATMPLELDWGVDGEVFEVTNGDFQKESMKIFGYDYTHEKLKGLRDLFIGTKTLYAYRLNSGIKASNTYATALCSGVRGNDLKIAIQANVDDPSKFDVITYLGTVKVDSQTVASAAELVANDYVTFNAEAELSGTAGTALSGGENGVVNGVAHQTYLDKIESYTYNIMGVDTTEETIKKLYVSFVKRMREEVGAKFQVVLHKMEADYMGVINVDNKTTDEGYSEAALVYWVTGTEAGCEVNKSCQNKKYDGEFTVDTNYTQSQLEKAIKAGKFVMHRVNADVRVLDDINSMVTTSDVQGDVFKDNQTTRVIDQWGNDVAVLFNTKYLGVVPNDNAGRISLWSDLCKLAQELENIRAIENFDDSDIEVTPGDTKKEVVVTNVLEPVNAMGKLYMTTTVA